MGNWDNPADNTWEPLAHLDCDDIIAKFEKENGAGGGATEKKRGEKRKSEVQPVNAPSKAAKKLNQNVKGFAKGLSAEKIIGATNDPGELFFLIKWKNSDEADLVAAKEANVKIPQIVIKFYEERLNCNTMFFENRLCRPPTPDPDYDCVEL